MTLQDKSWSTDQAALLHTSPTLLSAFLAVSAGLELKMLPKSKPKPASGFLAASAGLGREELAA